MQIFHNGVGKITNKSVLIILIIILLNSIIISENVKAEPPITIDGFVYIDGTIQKPQTVSIKFPSNSGNGTVYENGSYNIINITSIKNGENGTFTITYNGKSYTPPETVTRESDKNYYTVNLHINITPVADAGGPYTGTKCSLINFIGSAINGIIPYIWYWDFGDGNTSALQNPTHQYTNDGNYTATLTVTDNVGTIDTITATVTILTPTLVADANGPYNGLSGVPISFEGNANGGCTPYNYSWDFGDGTTKFGANPIHTYSNNGLYTITLSVTDHLGIKETNTTIASIDDSNLTVNAGGPYSGKVNTAIHFYGSATGGTSYTWDWDFGDGSTHSNLQNPTHAYTSTGTKTVTLTVTSGTNITSDSTSVSVTRTTLPAVHTPPTAEAGGPYNANINQTITFDGSASNAPDGTITGYRWDYGNDGIYDTIWSNKSTSTRIYSNIGTYTVKLQVKDDLGAAASDTALVTISQGNIKLKADAGGPYYDIIGNSIQFDGSQSYNLNGTIQTYKWSFGDGNTSTSITPTHTYSKEGNYTISLTITDDNNNIDTNITYTIITKKANHPPETPTISGIISSHINTKCNYTIKASDIDNDKIQYIINWDDETNQTITPLLNSNTVFNTSHNWSTGGIYKIIVYTLDENNATSENQIYKVLIDAYICGSIGYLIDKNGDDIFDVFYSETTGKENLFEKNNDEYNIDINGDKKWDYTYNLNSNTVTELTTSNQGFNLLLAIPIICLIIFVVVIFIYRRFIYKGVKFLSRPIYRGSIFLSRTIKSKEHITKKEQYIKPKLEINEKYLPTTNKIYAFTINDEKTKKMHEDIDKLLSNRNIDKILSKKEKTK